MKKTNLTKTLLAWLCIFFAEKSFAFPCLHRTGLPPLEVANLLGWVPLCSNLCGGYYKEPAIIQTCEKPPEINAASTTITADKTISFSAEGTSVLEGNVVVTQPGRKMTAERAELYREPVTHDISQVLLKGNVHYFEPGKHLVAKCVFVDLKKKYVKLDDVLYRFAKNTACQGLNAWGQAECVIRKSESDITLRNATYTTCPPVSQTWKIFANKLHINRECGWGEAVDTYMYIHGAPLIWVPYFSFPTDKRRKTGFLFPTAGYSNEYGLNISFPYYLNLAPNYDATLVPGYIFRRGANFETHFRYLTCNSVGNLSIEYIPYDSKFAEFRRTAPLVYGVTPDTIHFLNRIENASNGRGLLSFADCTRFDEHWWGNISLNYVTDDYYLQDFAYNPFNSSKDQLLNQAELNYASENWRFLGRVQTYQTLHPINQQPILDQHSRLPQLFITSDYPDWPNHLNFQINSEFVYFDHPKNFITRQPITTGERFHLQPSVDFPLITPWSFFIPKLYVDATYYDLRDRINNEPSNIARVLPIFDVDTGIYLERKVGCFTQTLEPRLFYLYVPYANQDNIPRFDTTLPPFNFSQLFRINRFVGYDRLGDANQLSISLTTRLLDGCTGDQRIRASIGQLIYFQQPEVCLLPDCSNDFYAHKNLSPLVGELNYYLGATWDTVAGVAIDPEDQGLNNASVEFHYHPDCRHLFNIGYEFVRKGDTLTTYEVSSSQNNLNRINLALAWQLNDNWQVLANLNYNLSHGHPQAYFYGFQYDSCCWAIRFVASRIVIAEDMNDVTTYQTNYYVQLQLKGLGNVGNSDPGKLLTSSIFGYQDSFRS